RREDGRSSREGPMRFRLVVNGEGHEVETDGEVTLDGRHLEGKAVEDARGITVHIGKKRYRVMITRWGSMVEGTPYRVEVRDLETREGAGARAADRPSLVSRVEVRPPMPGRIVRVLVKVGAHVSRGAPVAVLEAMKMQNEIPSPMAGVVREIRVREGESVTALDVVVVLESA